MSGIAFTSRQTLVEKDGVNVASGANFGIFHTGRFSRFVGMASVIGSMTIRIRTDMSPTAPAIVTSNWIVNSGPNLLDTLNYGTHAAFDVIAATSQAACSILIVGEPQR